MSKKKSNKSVLWIVLILIALIIALIAFGGKNRNKGTQVEVFTPQTRSITEIIPANGKIQPVVEVKISPDVSGEIIELKVEEGDHVKAGELLIKIKQDQYISVRERTNAAVNQAKAQLSQQQASFSQIELSYLRNKKLYEQKTISQAEFEKAESDYAIAQEQLKAAEFNVQSAEASLSEAKESLVKTTIYAPMSGTISRLDVERGERVVGTSQMAGTEMLRIADLSQMEVLVDVNENDIVRINLRDTALVEVDAYPNRQFKGIVTQIANSAKNINSALEQVTNFEVKVRILPESYQDLVKSPGSTPFRPGMSASVSILTETVADALAIPIQCVTARADLIPDSLRFELDANQMLEQVFVVEDGKAKVLRITTGIQDHNFIQVLEGLPAGATVISGPYTAISKDLFDGDRVTVAEGPVRDVAKKGASVSVSVN